MKFKTQKPKDYKEFVFKTKDGYKTSAFYKENHSTYYEKIYKEKLTHIEFYGETISETGYKSWFGNLQNFVNIEDGIVQLANYLEDITLKEHPNLILEIQQTKLF